MRNFAELGSLAEFVNGAAFKPEDWGDEGKRIIRIQNLTDSTKPFNRTKREVAAKLHVHPGDLLVSWSASLGVFEWREHDVALLNQHIFRVLPDERRVSKRYLRFGLERALIEMQRHLHGATMQHVNRGAFLSTKIFLPPLPEQRRIAEVLDRANALRTQRREMLATLGSLPRADFLESFGDPVRNPRKWPRKPLGTLLVAIESGWSPTCLDRPVRPSEWGVLKLGAVTRCEYDPIENKALPKDATPRTALEVKAGDLLFTRKNTAELVAACALVRESPPQLMLPDLIFRLRLRNDAGIDVGFLHQLLIYPSKRREVQKRARGSAGSMPNISKARLATVDIEMPPLELQLAFVRRVAAVEALCRTVRRSIEHLDQLFASLRDDAFCGTL